MLHCSLFLLKSNRVELTVVFKSSSIVIQPIDAQESFDIAHGHPLTTSLDQYINLLVGDSVSFKFPTFNFEKFATNGVGRCG